MKCLYADDLGIQTPDRIILTDNGAYDLQKQGIEGYYVWIGYRHGRGVSASKMDYQVRVFKNTVVIPALMEKLGVPKERIHSEDLTKTTDMYRVYVEVRG